MIRFNKLSSIEKGVYLIFEGLKDEFGLDLTDANFKNTPERIARAYYEIFSGIKATTQQVKKILQSSFPCENDEMIIAKNIRAFSMCPHHLLPVDYTLSIAYIPSVGGQVIGLSKLSRLAIVLARRPVLQEQLVTDISKSLMLLNGCVAAGCVAEGRHYCMIMRGVNQPDAFVTTSSLKGVFLEDTNKGRAARAELMGLIK